MKRILSIFLATVICIPAVFGAANVTWSGNVNTNWSEAGNWNSSLDLPPSAGDNLNFYGSTQTITHNDMGVDFSVRKIVFTTASPSYTFEGDRINLSNVGIRSTATNPQTFNFDITIDSVTTIQATSPTFFNGAIVGTGGPALTEGGEITFSGSNTFTGVLSIHWATLNVHAIKDSGTPNPIGSCARIVFGNNNTTGTLNYTGTGDTWHRTFKIGENNVDTSGDGVMNNNGSPVHS